MDRVEGQQPRERITAPTLRRRKREGRPITMLTAYDSSFARLLDACDIDVLLVGDSLGMVIKGEPDTLSVTVDEVIYHTRAVARGVERAMVVADMPFMSYQASLQQGVENAGRLVKQGRASAVKIEGGGRHVDLIERLVEIGIPVIGHLGLTPQSINVMGGYRVQGRGREQADQLMQDALAVQQAGACALVLEAVPCQLAGQITEALQIPTIGIGAGADCDGQVLVLYDLLGLDDRFSPKFVKKYDDFATRVREATTAFAADVRDRRFPTLQHSFLSGAGGEARQAGTDRGGGGKPVADTVGGDRVADASTSPLENGKRR